ncbi:MAG: MMPL family transporter [Candidatus Cloacimonetes bacterium]|nr:MMPL family transporter [Candidatus Cloacimonadota bacterium]
MNNLRYNIANFVFSNRKLVISIFLLITLFLGFQATHLKIDAGFEKQLPFNHEYIKTFMKHKEEFGGANRLLISVSPKKGDIFTPQYFKLFKKVSDESFFVPGVNRSSIQSIFTPNVRFVEIVDGGFSGGNIVPAEFDGSQGHIDKVKQNILKSSIIGRLVANDFTAALVSLQLSENDPKTGEKIDYFKVSRMLEDDLRTKFQDPNFDIHIIGFAKAVGDVASGAKGVIKFLFLTIILTVFLIQFFIKSWRFSVIVVCCSIIGVIWNLGILTLMGFGLDPMSILIPFLIFAIGVSHGIQMINGVNIQMTDGFTCFDSSKRAFTKLVIPGIVALCSDTIGFVTIYLIEIRIIQEMAVTASIGVLGLILTNLLLLPVILSFCKDCAKHKQRVTDCCVSRQVIWNKLSVFTSKSVAVPTMIISLVILILAYGKSQDLKIGDLHPGVPELRASSTYNMDTKFIVDKYSIGVDILNVIVETSNDACIDHKIMNHIDNFQWYVSNNPNVQSTISLAQIAKIITAAYNEGHYKWRELSRNTQNMVQAVSGVETSTGLLNASCSVMPVMIFSKDHKAESINSIVKDIKDYTSAHPMKDVNFKLATGNVGVMAATNDTVKEAQLNILLWIYACVIVLCTLLFRSFRATFCVIIPLTIVSVLAYALMAWLEIGLKTSTLPVAAFGVGIGVDYGIYIFSQLIVYIKNDVSLKEAYIKTLETNGNAVLITGLTLSLSVCTWVYSDLQFQADMGILFGFMLIANMIGAICLLPALAWFFYPNNRK